MNFKDKQSMLCFILLLFFVKTQMVGQIMSNSSKLEEGMQERKSSFNMDEIKVRWKKAALENCLGAPCVTPPTGPPPFSCGTSNISDINNNSYPTVLIGTQCWMKENLRVTKYNDGSDIALDVSGGLTGTTSQSWTTQTTGAITAYGYTPDSLAKYGYLYNRLSLIGGKKICPAGWHVPTPAEWTVLVKFLEPGNNNVPTAGIAQSPIVGGKLKMTGESWKYSAMSGADNSSGFSALPAGFRDNAPTPTGEFKLAFEVAHFWASGSTSLYVVLEYIAPSLSWGNYQTDLAGHSVRCIKDAEGIGPN
jgi:uncharacterized protein (TIGR02145 family)